MSSPRLALIPLALLSLATAAPVAGAANRGTVKLGCSTADAKGFVYAVKPKTCLGYDARTDASTTFTASKLKWKSWGASKATATGSLATAAGGAEENLRSAGSDGNVSASERARDRRYSPCWPRIIVMKRSMRARPSAVRAVRM